MARRAAAKPSPVRVMDPAALPGVFEVYRNLTRACWSIRDPRTRRVVGHATSLVMADATFRVSERIRQRVLRTRKKEVHAVARGTILERGGAAEAYRDAAMTGGVEVEYRPFVFGYFYVVGDWAPIHRARAVTFGPGGGVAALPWANEPDSCPHDPDDEEGCVTTQYGEPYVYHRCAACGRETHDPDRMQAAGLRRKRVV